MDPEMVHRDSNNPQGLGGKVAVCAALVEGSGVDLLGVQEARFRSEGRFRSGAYTILSAAAQR
eukprot:2582583-Alexandrium_andersonii.AAC.1